MLGAQWIGVCTNVQGEECIGECSNLAALSKMHRYKFQCAQSSIHGYIPNLWTSATYWYNKQCPRNYLSATITSTIIEESIDRNYFNKAELIKNLRTKAVDNRSHIYCCYPSYLLHKISFINMNKFLGGFIRPPAVMKMLLSHEQNSCFVNVVVREGEDGLKE